MFAPGTPQSYTCGNASQTVANLSTDPRFIAPATGDFHVQRASPVVAAGDINAPMLPPLDLDGRNRTVCGTVDMGAYEIHPQPAIAITSSSNPSVGGTPVTFTATVAPNCNVPTGHVTFLDGAAVLGTATLNQGAAGSLTTSSLIAGTHTITVQYGGDGNFDPSVSGPFTQLVTGQPTMTTLQVSPNPANPFAPVLLSSTVTGAGGVPTGSVTWTANGTPVATAQLSGGGTASATVTSLGAGSYTIVAAYSADIHFAPSASAPLVEVVNGAATAMAGFGSPNPATAVQTVTLTAVVQSLAGGGMPAGSVTFSEGTAVLGTAVLDGHGQGSVTVGPLPIGQHLIVARYAGGALFNAASASFTEAVTPVPSSVMLTAAPNPANQGQSVTLVATVAAANATPAAG